MTSTEQTIVFDAVGEMMGVTLSGTTTYRFQQIGDDPTAVMVLTIDDPETQLTGLTKFPPVTLRMTMTYTLEK